MQLLTKSRGVSTVLVDYMYLVFHFCYSVMLGSYDATEDPLLYMVDPSGLSWVSYCSDKLQNNPTLHSVLQGYKGVAIGKAKQAAKTELEKLKVMAHLDFQISTF